MIKIFTVVGARPQFIKAAVISRLIRDVYHDQMTEVLVHTGQHYDQNMSDIFFTEMDIPKPDFHLEVNEKTHGAMTGKMLHKLEELMLSEKPDIVLVYGDTNSTLAGALAASKLHIPLAHVEAGLRSFWKKMPEEQNRILTDHLSDWLFCPTNTAVDNLKNEGINKGVYNVGDIMLDSFIYYSSFLSSKELNFGSFDANTLKSNFALLTLHRAENTSDKSILQNIFSNISELNNLFIFPIHPRTNNVINEFGLKIPNNIYLIPPVGYFEILYLLNHCSFILTDSGGLQKEAFFAGKKCFTLREQTEWVETLSNNWNTLLDPSGDITSKINTSAPFGEKENHFGMGNTGEEIIKIILNGK
ncbi:MAG: UDP-N-acetylglucosamine 2-epimerase (non-hydrolyzing) [Cyclobacteriaceae bacterium]|nr:UDP-N-acetylglucosamine 2-epimerase (non-hydrolyzing) [Cyclobacteriaceae bacterium]